MRLTQPGRTYSTVLDVMVGVLALQTTKRGGNEDLVLGDIFRSFIWLSCRVSTRTIEF